MLQFKHWCITRNIKHESANQTNVWNCYQRLFHSTSLSRKVVCQFSNGPFRSAYFGWQISNRYMYIIANVMNIPYTKMIVQVFLFTNKSTQLKQFFLIMVFQDDFFLYKRESIVVIKQSIRYAIFSGVMAVLLRLDMWCALIFMNLRYWH